MALLSLQRLIWQLPLVLALVVNVVIASPSAASASLVTHVVISELQTATTASASQEFVELYNPGSGDVPLTGWTVEYKSATSTDVASSWTKRASLGGTLKAHGFYLIAPLSYLATADADWTATLAASGGHVRLKDNQGNVVDQLGYGTSANAAEGAAPAAAPPAGQSIERLPGRLNELGGNSQDTNNNAADFVLREVPLPQNSSALIEIPGDPSADLAADPDPPSVVPDAGSNDPIPVAAYAPLMITELLVNPAAPLTDSHDEYVELYNPTAGAVNIQGYALRAGSNFHSYYILPDQVLGPASYTAVYAYQSKLSLPNSGGAVQLLDPAGTVVDTTPVYGAAAEGQAWAYFETGWQWTLQLTPGQPNILASLPVATKASTLTKPTSSKAKVAPKSSTKTAAKVTKPKAAAKPKTRVKKASKPKSAVKAIVAAERNLKPASWLLIGLAVLTIGYAAYEFRYDLQNIYYRLRGHQKPRTDDRPASKGGRGD